MNLPSHLKSRLEESWRERIALLVETLQNWPWMDTLRTLRQRFREDHLGLTASSLTFTTLISLVPLVTVTLAVFAAFPMFASFQESLQKYFLQSLVPDNIAKQVMTALTQFAAKANRLGTVGLVFLFFAALALMLTIDRTLNAIWRVRKPRPIAQRVLVYWAAATLGPLVLGVSLSLTSYVISASRGLVSELPGGVSLLLNTIEFVLLAAGMAALFHYVPNTHVKWRHAIAGGVFVSIGFEVAKKALAWYIAQVPTFAVVYGAFATLPILLVWIYLGWVIVLLGAVIAAYAPSLQMRVARWPDAPGSRFGLAVALLVELERARRGEARGLSLAELSESLRVDPLQAEPIVDALVEMDWLARLDEPGAARYVLLAEPATTPAAPLLAQMLLEPSPALRAFRDRAGFDRLTLAELLQR
ncbi:YihY family inner membrane protein [uncultured Piscinibacter sp.]|uniref:YihY family inner membrane protein n=1 Tax=uncultured Piscinibacter sp. TaxID=1131835 RepID=UPI0026054D31|nr:YihY family inner membrane protein [uncultured Piscinibacter sp.]